MDPDPQRSPPPPAFSEAAVFDIRKLLTALIDTLAADRRPAPAARPVLEVG
jgi:hypothetical protein